MEIINGKILESFSPVAWLQLQGKQDTMLAYGKEEEKRSRNSNDLQGLTRKEEQSGGGELAELAQITWRETNAHSSGLHGV